MARYRSNDGISLAAQLHWAPISRMSRATRSSFLFGAPDVGRNSQCVRPIYVNETETHKQIYTKKNMSISDKRCFFFGSAEAIIEYSTNRRLPYPALLKSTSVSMWNIPPLQAKYIKPNLRKYL